MGRATAVGIDRARLVRVALGLATFFGLALAAVALFRAPVFEASRYLVHAFGREGFLVGMLVTEASPLPLVNEPLLLFAHAGGLSLVEVWLSAGLASMAAGPLGYGLGRAVGRRPAVAAYLARLGFATELTRRGAAFVALAAVLPMPFAACCWTAGAVGTAFGPFVVACSLRLAKFGLVTLAIAGGIHIV